MTSNGIASGELAIVVNSIWWVLEPIRDFEAVTLAYFTANRATTTGCTGTGCGSANWGHGGNIILLVCPLPGGGVVSGSTGLTLIAGFG